MHKKLFKQIYKAAFAGLLMLPLTAALAETYTSTDTPIPFPDLSTINSTINVPATALIQDVNVLIDMNHTYVGDLRATVTSPTGTAVILFDPSGGSNLINGGYTFDDTALTTFVSAIGGTNVALGTYSPLGSLASFNGENPSGNWTLTLEDLVGADSGTLNFWQLILLLGAIDQAYVSPAMQAILSGNTSQLVGTFEDRKAAAFSSSAGNSTNPYALGNSNGFWVRAGGRYVEADGAIRNLFMPATISYEDRYFFVQGGPSFQLMQNAGGRIVGSVFGHASEGDSDFSDGAGVSKGSLDTRSVGFGGSLSWLGNNGMYADFLALASWQDIDVTLASGATGSTDGRSLAASLETGFRYPLNAQFSLIPQAQLVYQRSELDSFLDTAGTTSAFPDGDAFKGRLGVAVEYAAIHQDKSVYKANASANVVHDFSNDSRATVNGDTLGFEAEGTGLMVSAGISVVPAGGSNKFGLQGSYTKNLSGDGEDAIALHATVGWNW